MEETAKVDKAIHDFMSVTAKSKVAVIVPLYGFWGDIKDNPVNGEVLKTALSRLYSQVHQLYIIFIANPETLPTDAKKKNSVGNILMGKAKGGNTVLLPIERKATYNEYIQIGMEYALNETNAQFVVVFNPWILIQDQGLDILVDRVNRADDAKMVSGYDLALDLNIENFDSFKELIPKEEWNLSFDFVAMPRYLAEMINLDEGYQTHVFLQRDIWQQVAQKSFAAISSQRIPIFTFIFPWNEYETQEAFEADKAHFASKWLFDPGLKYKDPAGDLRKDKGAR